MYDKPKEAALKNFYELQQKIIDKCRLNVTEDSIEIERWATCSIVRMKELYADLEQKKLKK
jgi:hypothetical protein